MNNIDTKKIEVKNALRTVSIYYNKKKDDNTEETDTTTSSLDSTTIRIHLSIREATKTHFSRT